MQENYENIIHGPKPHEPLLYISLGRFIFESLKDINKDGVCQIEAETKKEMKYGEFLQKICNLATFLRKNGFVKDSMVSICSENNMQFLIPLIAGFFTGATVAPLNHNYTLYELKHGLNLSKPQIVFCSEKVLYKFLRFQKELGYIKTIVVIDSNKKYQGVLNLNDLMKENVVNVNQFIPYDSEETSNLKAIILNSSGTTGLPKGVMLSHLNLLTILLQSRDPRFVKTKPGEYGLGFLPMFHGFGLITTIFYILQNKPMVVMRKFDEDLFLKCIQNYKISILTLVPPIAILLSKSSKVKRYDLSSLSYVVCAAAPLGKSTQEKLMEILKQDKLFIGYGLTETTLGVTLFGYDDFKTGSCGKLVPYMMAKIRDVETGKTLKVNQTGELCFKGPLIMMGYYNNEEATKDSFTSDGWLKTGDIGYYDEEGYFYIVDRLKELIKYKAYQVAPAELEALLINHPRILDAGVVGLPDEEAGELPLAFVVKKPNITLSEKDVEEYIARVVSSQKKLRGGVIFVNSIPKNPTGKILRKELRNMLKNLKSKM